MATSYLSYVQQMALADMFEWGPRNGRPDWRPDLYKRWLEDVIADPTWQAKFK